MKNFYPVTPEVSRILRAAKLTAAEWRIWSYLIEIEPWGDAYQDVSTLTVLQNCDVSKATYYRAIAKFQELELFDFQDKGISIRNLRGVSSLKNETAVSKMRQQSQECDSSLKNETTVSKTRQPSQKRENQPPKPLQHNDSSVPHTIQTYTDFKKTLSDGERENFLNFVREKTKDFSPQINDIEGWLAKKNEAEQNRWEVYYDLFHKSQPELVQAAQNTKWENHPLRDEWLAEIEKSGNPLIFAGRNKEKQEFVKWANENKIFSWFKEEEQ